MMEKINGCSIQVRKIGLPQHSFLPELISDAEAHPLKVAGTPI